MKTKGSLLFLLSLFLFACESKETPEEGPATYKVLHGGPCGSIIYSASLGNDYDSALEEVVKLYKSVLSPYEPDSYYIDAEIITVDFTDDDRLFYYVTFRDRRNDHSISSGTVLDSYGNHYGILWCDD
jgi:hypothetical protein